MALKLKVNLRGRVIKIIGRVDTNTAPQLDSKLKKLIDRGKEPIVVDMSEVEFFSAPGIRVLSEALRKLGEINTITLLNMPSKIKRAFDLSGFLKIFNVVD